MDSDKIKARMADMEKGVATIDAQIKSMSEKIQQLTQSRVVTLGAIADCQHWLSEIDKSEKEGADDGTDKQ